MTAGEDEDMDLTIDMSEAERTALMIIGEKEFDMMLGLRYLMEGRSADVMLGLSSDADNEPYASKIPGWIRSFKAEDGEMKAEGRKLARMGLVRARSGVFELTEDGKKAHKIVKKDCEKWEVWRINDLVGTVDMMPEAYIMDIVLRYYPYMAGFDKQSSAYEDLMSARRRLATHLYKNGKIGPQNAALMADTHMADFLRDADRR